MQYLFLPTTSAMRAERQRVKYLYAIVIAVGVAIAGLSVLGGELLVRQREAASVQLALARSEAGTRVAQQLIIRRLEATDVLHRLAQSWFSLREDGNRQGQAVQEHELARIANSGAFGIVQVAIIDPTGWMTWSSVPGSEAPVYLGDREHFRIHAEGSTDLFVSRPLVGRVSNRWTIQLTRRMHTKTGGFAGVVVVSMDLARLSDALAEVKFDDNDYAGVLRTDGTITALSQQRDLIGTRLPDGDPLLGLISERSRGSVQRAGPGGALTATGWARVPDTPLVTIYAIDLAEALADDAPVRRAIRGATAAVAVATVAFTVLLVVAAARRRAAATLAQLNREKTLLDANWRGYAQRIAGLPAVIYDGTVDADGQFQLGTLSESVQRITGWKSEEMRLPGAWRQRIDTEISSPSSAFFRDVVRNGEGLREYRLRRPGGEWMWVRDRARVIGTTGAGETEIVGYVADITEERNLQLRAQAAGRLAVLGEMATGLAHELNQPLAVMSLAADNAIRALNRRGEAAIKDVLERLERIAAHAERARRVVDHLRIFGRVDEGEPEETSLAEAVRGALVLTHGVLRNAGITTEVAVPADLPPVRARLVPLEQALVNLVINARDAISDRAGREGASAPQGQIRLVASISGQDEVTLIVSDNGGGIAPEVIERLFEPFFTTKPAGKGTGLGLPICHSTMRGFGGDITAMNINGGAAFTLRFRAVLPASAGETGGS